MMGTAVRLMLPRALAHPVEETKKGLLSRKDKVKSSGKDAGDSTAKKSRKASKALGDVAEEASKKTKKGAEKGRRKLSR